MKTEINKIQKILLLIIGILAIVLAIVLLHKGYQLWQDKKQEQEWAVRHDEVQTEIDSVRQQIQELSSNPEALQVFLEENVNQVIVIEEEMQEEPETQETQEVSEAPGTQETPENREAVSDAIIIEEAEPEPTEEIGQQTMQAVDNVEITEGEKKPIEYKGDAIIVEEPPVVTPEETETPTAEPEKAETPTEEPEEAGTPTAEPEETAAPTEKPQETGAESISGNAIVDGEVIPYKPEEKELTLEERRNIRSSYEETKLVNEEDKAVISSNTYDFSNMKITCLGDSITEGSNLDNLENYQQYSYPSVLKNLLQAKEICNLGIGGSSYGRYWDQAFVDRYKEIPQDTDIIVIMGGTNDGFAASSEELGSLEEKAPRTFYGDVDELMRGLKSDYPEAKIIFVTPLPNALHDYLRNQRDYLLPQSVFADAVKELAEQHQIDVIDLYNSNILDTHDAQIISEYMPDGVHGNPAGYQILAEHIASGVIRIMEQDEMEKSTVSGNVVPGMFDGSEIEKVKPTDAEAIGIRRKDFVLPTEQNNERGGEAIIVR